MLERKVWIDTGQVLFPNLYVILVAKAGIGKSTAITEAKGLLQGVEGFHLGPDSVTGAALADCLANSTRVRHVPPPKEIYNTMFLMADEFSVMMNKWDTSLVSMLTKFYDGTSYKEAKRRDALRHDIKKPNLSLLCGTTPSNLLETVPGPAWRQGLMSRILLIYTQEKEHKNILNGKNVEESRTIKLRREALTSDLAYLHQATYGELIWDEEFSELFDTWRRGGCEPVPRHPKLEDYCSRRFSHLLKLGMVAAVDSGSTTMTKVHYMKAKHWLEELEACVDGIFTASSTSPDYHAMAEIEAWLRKQGRPVSKEQLLSAATRFIPALTCQKIVELMWASGRLKKDKTDRYLPND